MKNLHSDKICILLLESLLLIIRAGTPPTVHPVSEITSDTTTALAAMATLDEIVTSPIIFAPLPINTLSPMFAALSEPFLLQL